ncbi:TonB-dependent receptor [Haloferula chungangensis]|uniref:TonB-dependent receptor n=1 Tax=Haloferula chungangensis TaxID=1048331 RepID=A0ABW2L7D3_9BACT
MKHPSTRTPVSSRELLALATFATMANSLAQDSNSKPASDETRHLDETVIEATSETPINPEKLSSDKATAPLLDTPQSFSVIPEAVFNEQGARNLTDVLRNTPGISFNAGENGFSSSQDNFSLRGTDASGSIYVDGIRDSGSYTRDVYNIERVEVAKGAAADNGRGGSGGYINLVSKSALADEFYRGTTSLGYAPSGGDALFRQTLDFNMMAGETLMGDTAVRLNAMFQDGGVYGREVADQHAWGIAPSITFGLGSATQMSFSFQHDEARNRPDWGVPAAMVDGMIHYDPTIGESNRNNFYGLTSDFDNTITDSLTGIIQHEFSSGGILTNTSRISKTTRNSIYTVPADYNSATHLVTTRQIGYGRENTLFANQTNFSYQFETGSLSHSISTGLELSREGSDADRYGTATDPGTGAPIPVFGSFPNRASGNFIGAPTEFSKIEIDTIAAYFYDTVEINEQWQVTAGLRLEHYDLDLQNIPGSASVPSFKKDDTYLNGKVGVVYKPRENGSIYGAVGVSSLPPGAYLSNPDISREGDNAFPGAGGGVNNPNADTQQSWNYEIGTKWDFCDGAISTTAAIFHTNRRNIVISDGRGGTIGEGEQNFTGIELGAAGKINDNWTVFGGFLAMTSERDHFDDYRNSAGRPEGSLADRSNVNGDELAFTPNYSANLWTTYDFDFGLTIGGGFQYVGSSYVGRTDDHDRIIPNGVAGKLPGYITFNALAAYNITEDVTLRLNVDNLFDEVYAVSTNWAASRAFLGAPRTFTLSADWTF